MFRCAVLFVLLALPLRANLGESIKQLVGRYGSPAGYTEATAQSPLGTLSFTASGYLLVIFLHGDTEVGARVSKTDKSAMSDAEQKLIMDQDLNGSHWVSVPCDDPNKLRWNRSDNAVVVYDQQKHMLIFTSDEMNKALQAAPPAPPAPAASTPVAVPPAAK